MVHEKGHDWGREPINRSERRILEACQASPRSTPELLKSLGYTTRTGNFRQALSRLIDAQLLELRYPDHPRSKRQQYRLTAKGRAVGAP